MGRALEVEPLGAVQVQALGPDRALGELARRQHATVARRQLLALGFSRHEVAGMLEKERLRVVHRGVYAVGPARLTRKGRWMAAVLAAGPGAVLSHRAAGALLDLVSDHGGVIDVSRTAACHNRRGIRIHNVRLGDDEVTTVDGIPVTTAARTLLDLAAELPPHKLERAMNEAEVRRLGDTTSLGVLIDRYPRRQGTRNLRAVLATHDLGRAITKSELEDRFLAFLDDYGFQRPCVNVIVADVGECDFVWPEARLIVELDGYRTHGTRRQFEADRARDRALQVAGWRVIRVTARQLHDNPAHLAADLRALLRAAPVSS